MLKAPWVVPGVLDLWIIPFFRAPFAFGVRERPGRGDNDKQCLTSRRSSSIKMISLWIYSPTFSS
jgi:hypothetical protein